MTNRNTSFSHVLPYREILTKALEADNHIRIFFETRKQAWKFRMECYAVRAKDRKLAERERERDSPLWGRSLFDDLMLTIGEEPDRPGKKFYCKIQRNSDIIQNLEIEEG